MSQKDHGDAEVFLPSGKWASVVGRNGTFTPRSVRIWQGSENAHIDAVGMKGRVLRAGIEMPVESMDSLAMGWLQSRGIVMPVK